MWLFSAIYVFVALTVALLLILSVACPLPLKLSWLTYKLFSIVHVEPASCMLTVLVEFKLLAM